MRLFLAIVLLLFAGHFALVTHTAAASVHLPAGQVSDFLNAVKSAVAGKSSKRRRRRTRGSNRPVLAKPPVPPVRRPGNAASVADPSLSAGQDNLRSAAADNAETPTPIPPSPKVKLRPALIAALPNAGASAIAVPTRRPEPTRKSASVTTVDTVTNDENLSEVVPPPPTEWDAAEITAAYDRCDALLGQLTVDIEPVAPMRKGACGTPGPVRLSSLGESTSVAVRPAATLNCKTVARIHKWLEQKVQPAAVKILQSRVVRIRNVSSYACRNRNNAKTGKLSEHALGNALDIASFVLADGRKVSVLKDWGTVKRDLVAQSDGFAGTAQRRPTVIKTKRRSKRRATQAAVIANAAVDNRVALPTFKGPVRRGVRLNRVPDPGGPAANVVAEVQPKPKKAAAPQRPPAKSRFLKQVHADACGIFSTVLGPEANNAHRDHFHFDTATRSYKAYCR